MNFAFLLETHRRRNCLQRLRNYPNTYLRTSGIVAAQQGEIY